MTIAWETLFEDDWRRSREAIQGDYDHLARQLGRRGVGLVWGGVMTCVRRLDPAA